MPRKQFQTLTEQMYYILLSLLQERCGVDIMNSVQEISKGRIKVGPGTLYTLLSKFEKEKIIIETSVEGRKKSYIITDYGKEILNEEYKRLNTLVRDGELFIQGESYEN
ncbi:PadR family transcriptional regulator [Clostridium sp. B9]|uniref:PadR family transcriptional regulator n=1 Tax=Clostridium sp. B9 TaxID=3423224 RepID=UPI003D2EE095